MAEPAASPHDPFFRELDRLVRRDPGGRGVANCRVGDRLIAEHGLWSSAHDLAINGINVAIVTGFYVQGPEGPTIETDGPPGSLYLARVLTELGVSATIVTDRLGMRALEVGCRQVGLPADTLVEFPHDGDEACLLSRQCVDGLLALPWSHIIAVERCGPSHTAESLAAQQRIGPVPLADFETAVAAHERDTHRNMRGHDIDEHTANTHLLFDAIRQRRLPITTIGIADGGNEIGMGCVPWEVLRAAIAIGPSHAVACRIATDHLCVAGVSNWGAYALAAGVCKLRGNIQPILDWDENDEAALVRQLVEAGGAVDGVTRLPEATADGLPLQTYLQPLTGIRRSCET